MTRADASAIGSVDDGEVEGVESGEGDLEEGVAEGGEGPQQRRCRRAWREGARIVK